MRRGSGKVVAGSPPGPFWFHSFERAARTRLNMVRIDQPFRLYSLSL